MSASSLLQYILIWPQYRHGPAILVSLKCNIPLI